MQIREVSRLICLRDFSWLDALLLNAENFIVDASLSNLFYLNFSAPDHEYMFYYEIMNLCLCFKSRKLSTHTIIHEESSL